jgi:AAA domain/Bifunctional DNA primase/polymerase, N-terminal
MEPAIPSGPQNTSYPPLGLPKEARIFALLPNQKRPVEGDVGAHHNALPLSEATLVPVPNASYGIALSTAKHGSQWMLVDQDKENEAAAAFTERLPATWMQRTRRGTHWLYRVPSGFRGRNEKWAGGDLKVNGYIVGPGSTVDGHVYELLSPVEPADAPSWLLELCSGFERVTEAAEARSAIPKDERDIGLTSIAGTLRGRLAFNPPAIEAALWAIVQAGLVEQPEGDPILRSDCARIARSIGNKPAESPLGRIYLNDANWLRDDEVSLISAPLRWWLWGFVPKGLLTLLYGPGGAGKSSFGSWLAAQVGAKGAVAAYLGVEEPFELFALRARRCGAPHGSIVQVPGAHDIRFPRDCAALGEKLVQHGVDFLFVDSIYTHFAASQGDNAAEKARATLSSLAHMAQAFGLTIYGQFHENKVGDYLGSAEMLNVPRYVLKGTRKRNNKGKFIATEPFVVSVDKHNIWDPGYAMTFHGEEVLAFDERTGEVWMHENREGKMEPGKIKVAVPGPDRPDEAEVPAEIDATNLHGDDPLCL